MSDSQRNFLGFEGKPQSQCSLAANCTDVFGFPLPMQVYHLCAGDGEIGGAGIH